MESLNQVKANQVFILISSTLISLSAGTNYAFSIYSPQLAQNLKLSSTLINAIGLSANLGMYISSPLVGRLIDSYGPLIPLISASILLSFGYGLLAFIYSNPSFSNFNASWAMLACLLTGIGSSTAHSSAAGAIARSFGIKIRATAIGFVLAGFGLSAFFWSNLAQILAKDNTSKLISLLALGPSSFILLGTIGYQFSSIHSNFLIHSNIHQSSNSHQSIIHVQSQNNLKQNPESTPLIQSHSNHHHHHHQTQLSGWSLIKQYHFWYLWIIMGSCCGTALMTINNIGTLAATLYQKTPNHLSPLKEISSYQSDAVSILSLFNCLGRIFAGALTDKLQTSFGIKRVWWLSVISIIFLISQLLAMIWIERLDQINFLASLVGFAYGNIYGTAPALVLDWFGIQNFTTNFGYLNLAPLLTGQIFNLTFGKVYDRHSSQSSDHNIINSSLKLVVTSNQELATCKLGPECFQDAFKLTFLACCLALILSLILGFKMGLDPLNPYDYLQSNHLDNSDQDDEQRPMIRSSSHH